MLHAGFVRFRTAAPTLVNNQSVFTSGFSSSSSKTYFMDVGWLAPNTHTELNPSNIETVQIDARLFNFKDNSSDYSSKQVRLTQAKSSFILPRAKILIFAKPEDAVELRESGFFAELLDRGYNSQIVELEGEMYATNGKNKREMLIVTEIVEHEIMIRYFWTRFLNSLELL